MKNYSHTKKSLIELIIYISKVKQRMCELITDLIECPPFDIINELDEDAQDILQQFLKMTVFNSVTLKHEKLSIPGESYVASKNLQLPSSEEIDPSESEMIALFGTKEQQEICLGIACIINQIEEVSNQLTDYTTVDSEKVEILEKRLEQLYEDAEICLDRFIRFSKSVNDSRFN
jgi:hypothetical protein